MTEARGPCNALPSADEQRLLRRWATAAELTFGPFVLRDTHTTIWLVTAWAFLPASLLMRGVALNRVAGLIYKKRKRAYKKAVAEGMLPA